MKGNTDIWYTVTSPQPQINPPQLAYFYLVALDRGVFSTTKLKNILLGPITAAGVTEAFQGFHQFLGFHEFMVALLSLGSPGNKVESSPPTGKLRNKKSCSYMKTGYWQNRGHSKHIFSRSCLMPTPLHEHARCPALSQLEAARWKRTWDGDDDDPVESPQGRRCTQGQYLPHPPSCTSACRDIGHA